MLWLKRIDTFTYCKMSTYMYRCAFVPEPTNIRLYNTMLLHGWLSIVEKLVQPDVNTAWLGCGGYRLLITTAVLGFKVHMTTSYKGLIFHPPNVNRACIDWNTQAARTWPLISRLRMWQRGSVCLCDWACGQPIRNASHIIPSQRGPPSTLCPPLTFPS